MVRTACASALRRSGSSRRSILDAIEPRRRCDYEARRSCSWMGPESSCRVPWSSGCGVSKMTSLTPISAYPRRIGTTSSTAPTQGAVDAEVRPLHGDRSASEETARDLRRLREPRDARARLEQRVAERSMLAFVPARAEPEGEAAVARAIDRGRHLHEQRRVPVCGATDHAAEGDPFRQDGPAGERDPALEHGAVFGPEGRIEMVVAPEAAEAQALDMLSRLHQLVPFDELTPHLQADVHGPGRYRDAGPVAAPIGARRRAASGRP